MMKQVHAPRVMISALASNSGKTSAACAIIASLSKRMSVSAFKTGPDYIDTQYHRTSLSIKNNKISYSHNLDSFLCGKRGVKEIIAQNVCDISIIEGAMGFYDGIGATTAASAYEISRITKTPVLVIIDPNKSALSIAALLKSFASFRRYSNIVGVILNRLSDKRYDYYKKIIEENTNLKVLGFLPEIKDASFKSRHLGLSLDDETVRKSIELLSDEVDKYVDLDSIIKIANAAPDFEYTPFKIKKIADVTIGVARDKAFSFYYPDSLLILEKMGAVIKYFSPIDDKCISDEFDALIFGGGYPELYLDILSSNISFIKSLQDKASSGMPIFAECGGFMYLGKSITHEGKTYNLCGIIDNDSKLSASLDRFGYKKLKSLNDNMLCNKGDEINAHEFHYSVSSNYGDSFLSTRVSGGAEARAIFAYDNIFAGYPHIHFYSNIKFAKNFVCAANRYKKSKKC